MEKKSGVLYEDSDGSHHAVNPSTYRAKRVSLQVWITAEERDRLKHLAIEDGHSVTDIIRSLIKERLDSHDAFVAMRGKSLEEILQANIATTEKLIRDRLAEPIVFPK